MPFLFFQFTVCHAQEASSVISNTRVLQDSFSWDSVPISEGYGFIGKKYVGKGKKKIIHIRDLHCHFQAQMNISRLLYDLNRSQNIDLILVEGAQGVVDTSALAKFPQEAIKQQVLAEWVKKGQVTGPEFLQITRLKDEVDIFGIDDVTWYLRNYKAYRDTYGNSQARQTVKFFLNWFNHLSKHIYQKRLLELCQLQKDHLINQISFTDYLKRLQALLPEPDFKSIPNLKLTFEIWKKTKAVDLKKVEEERLKMLADIEQSGVKEDVDVILTKSLEYRMGKLSTVEYFDFLRQFAPDKIKKYMHLSAYMDVIQLQNTLDTGKLGDELYEFEKQVEQSVITNEQEVIARDLERRLEQLDKLSRLEWNRRDWNDFKTSPEQYQFDVINVLLTKLEKEVKLKYSNFDFERDPTQLHPDSYQELLVTGKDFYISAVERDNALFKNAIHAMEDRQTDMAVVITGGFHSESLEKALEEKEISYIELVPSIPDTAEESPYADLMMDPHTAIDPAKWQIWNQNIALASRFNQPLLGALGEVVVSPDALGIGQNILEQLQRESTRVTGEHVSDSIALLEEKPINSEKVSRLIEGLTSMGLDDMRAERIAELMNDTDYLAALFSKSQSGYEVNFKIAEPALQLLYELQEKLIFTYSKKADSINSILGDLINPPQSVLKLGGWENIIQKRKQSDIRQKVQGISSEIFSLIMDQVLNNVVVEEPLTLHLADHGELELASNHVLSKAGIVESTSDDIQQQLANQVMSYVSATGLKSSVLNNRQSLVKALSERAKAQVLASRSVSGKILDSYGSSGENTYYKAVQGRLKQSDQNPIEFRLDSRLLLEGFEISKDNPDWVRPEEYVRSMGLASVVQKLREMSLGKSHLVIYSHVDTELLTYFLERILGLGGYLKDGTIKIVEEKQQDISQNIDSHVVVMLSDRKKDEIIALAQAEHKPDPFKDSQGAFFQQRVAVSILPSAQGQPFNPVSDILSFGMVLSAIDDGDLKNRKTPPFLLQFFKDVLTEYYSEKTETEILALASQLVEEWVAEGFFKMPPPGDLLNQMMEEVLLEDEFIDIMA